MNPYAPPEPGSEEPARDEPVARYGDASRWTRFLNVIIDYVGTLILGGLSGVALGGFDVEAIPEGVDSLLGIALYFSYYFAFESVFGATPGKWITQTRVVDEEGRRPSAGRIAARTLIRFVPYDAFSFFGVQTGGWHDRWSRTRVISLRARYLG